MEQTVKTGSAVQTRRANLTSPVLAPHSSSLANRATPGSKLGLILGNQASYHKLANTSCPSLLLGKQSNWATRQAITSWQTKEVATNWVTWRHDGHPGKLIKWQHTGSHTGKFGNQASTITGWQTLGNEMTLTDLLTSHIDEIYPQLQRYKTCLSLAFYIFQWQTI